MKTLTNMFLWNLECLKFDPVFINPCELQIAFSFKIFVLKMFVYEISKRSIIHMDFNIYILVIMIFKKLCLSKQLTFDYMVKYTQKVV